MIHYDVIPSSVRGNKQFVFSHQKIEKNSEKQTKMHSLLSQRIHECVAARYAKLPRKGKPNPTEWTVLAAFLLEHENNANNENNEDISSFSSSSSLEVVALATGNKCLGEAGRSRATQIGDVLNDCHAEVLARRAFVSYMMDQVERSYTPGADTILVRRDAKLCLKPGTRIHMYISQMPCGDCSIFKTDLLENEENENNEENEGDSLLPPNKKPKVIFEGYQSTGAKVLDKSAAGEITRSYAWDEKGDKDSSSSESQRVGACRSKPGRGSPTLSMSCSDKIALWNCVGLNGALLAQFVPDPLRPATITVALDCAAAGASPESLLESLRRGLVGRVSAAFPAVPEAVSVSLLPLSGEKTGLRPIVKSLSEGLNSSGLACVWSAGEGAGTYEVAMAAAGKKMGTTSKSWSNPSQRLFVCKYEMFSKFATLMSAYEKKDLSGVTYRQAKDRAREYVGAKRRAHETALSPWIPKPYDKEESFYPLLKYIDKIPN